MYAVNEVRLLVKADAGSKQRVVEEQPHQVLHGLVGLVHDSLLVQLAHAEMLIAVELVHRCCH
eukprot:14256174-Heterocapsa_arctica.AAC.1